jgi:endonuclease YncB( thermonuclease family)
VWDYNPHHFFLCIYFIRNIMSEINNEINELMKMTKRSADFIDFDGLTVIGKCVDVYDGDTVTVIFKTDDMPYHKYKLRVFNIDTPEIRTKDKLEKTVAYKARDFVSKLILDKLVLLELGKHGKYGRPLGKIYPRVEDIDEVKFMNKDISTMLIEEGLGVFYGGGKKIPFREWYSSDN